MLQRSASPSRNAGRNDDGSSTEPSRPRSFSDVHPKLPGDPTRGGLPRRELPGQPEPRRRLATDPPCAAAAGGSIFTDAEAAPGESTPKFPDQQSVSATRELPGGPRLTAAVSPRVISHNSAAGGPGPLTRLAADVEHLARRLRDRWQAFRSRRAVTKNSAAPTPRRADVHRQLAVIVGPLRTLGVVLVAGAVALGRESRGVGVGVTGSLVVLGAGLALAVVMFTLAELVQATRALLRRR